MSTGEIIDLTITKKKVNTGETKSNIFDARACSSFNSLATLKTLNNGEVISPIKKTKIAEIPPTPRRKEAQIYSPAKA